MTDWTLSQALSHAVGLPAQCYTDAALAQQERTAIWRRSWQLVAHSAALRHPGDHVLAEVDGVPLIVLRDEQGTLRALHNVCRHRGGPLATENGCGLKQLRCRYHGWTYTLGGQLRSGPELDAIEHFDRTQVRLPAVSVAQWQGLVYVALAAPVPDFAEVVDGIDARLVGVDLSTLRFHSRVSYTIACNWKTYVDNYLEGYHVPHMHPALNALLDYRSYRTECARWHTLQWSPLDNGASFYGAGTALYYFLWPNTMLNILPGRLQTNRVLPLAVDRCRVDFDYYYADALLDGHAEQIAQDQALAELTQQEDIDMCERVQRAFASGSYDTGRVHPLRETGIHHFQELYRAQMRLAGQA